jgi:hypothetical protein
MDEVGRRLRNAVVRYVREHPHAADTAAGIRAWWVAGAALGEPHVLTEVLESLVADGVLQRASLPGDTVLFVARPNGAPTEE